VWNTVAPGVAWRRSLVVDDFRILEWVVLRLDLSTARVRAESAPPMSGLATFGADADVIAAVNAGYFEPDHTPSGVLYSGGVAIGAPNARGGSGLLLLQHSQIEMVSFAPDLTPPSPTEIDLALQCGPRLIERDGSVGVHRDDHMRYARTAACLRDGGHTLDLVITWLQGEPMRGPGLYSFSRLLAARSPVGDARGCECALNLDGGPSTGMYVRGGTEASHAPLGPVPYWLVVRGSGGLQGEARSARLSPR
jgi:hypothetical protein